MYLGAPLTQISAVCSAERQTSPAYPKKPFSAACLSLKLALGKAGDSQSLADLQESFAYPVTRDKRSSGNMSLPGLALSFLFDMRLGCLRRGSQSF